MSRKRQLTGYGGYASTLSDSRTFRELGRVPNWLRAGKA
jgi:hypothetical protein